MSKKEKPIDVGAFRLRLKGSSIQEAQMLLYKILFIMLFIFLIAAPASPQTAPAGQTKGVEAQGAIRVDVNLVDVPVSVTGAHGQFITGLTPQNFRVYEDGRLQKIAVFEEEDVPVTVGLLVDHSGSMRPILPEVSAAAVAFAQSSNPKDEMFVVDFNDIVSLELPAAKPFTNDGVSAPTAGPRLTMRSWLRLISCAHHIVTGRP